MIFCEETVEPYVNVRDKKVRSGDTCGGEAGLLFWNKTAVYVVVCPRFSRDSFTGCTENAQTGRSHVIAFSTLLERACFEMPSVHCNYRTLHHMFSNCHQRRCLVNSILAVDTSFVLNEVFLG